MNRASFILSVLVSILLSPPADADIRYVDDDAPGGDGTTWATAYNDLQAVLTKARGNPAVTEIRIAGGTYLPGTARESTFAMIDGVTINGGYRGLAGGGDANDRDIETWVTVLSADVNGDDQVEVPFQTGDNCANVFHHPDGLGLTSAAVLDGCTITGGGMNNIGNSPTISHCIFWLNRGGSNGGALHNENCSATISHCTFDDNSANWGAGLYNGNCTTTISHCTFREHSTETGAAMMNEESDLTITDCTFTHNGGAFGGSMYNTHCDLTITRCRFIGEKVVDLGGALANEQCTVAITDCLFSGNTGKAGGAIHNYLTTGNVTNCTFSWNYADSGAAMHNAASTLTITNCVMWGNRPFAQSPIGGGGSTINVSYSCIQGGWAGVGNLDVNPSFVDACGPDGYPGTSDDDARLHHDSPCIDAGSNSAVPTDSTTDLDGEPRIMDDPNTEDTGEGDAPIVDMGAYEFGVDCNDNGIADTVDIRDGTSQDCNDNHAPDECENDADGDGVIDACDGCPGDPFRSVPGRCGCGLLGWLPMTLIGWGFMWRRR